MDPLAEAWNVTSAALPSGWRLESLRCTSTGLAPEQRADRWLAEACGPGGACLIAEEDAPMLALAALTRAVEDIRDAETPRSEDAATEG